MQGPLREGLTRIFTRSQRNLYKIMQDLWGFCHQDLHNRASTLHLQDLQDLLTRSSLRTSKAAPWNSCRIVIAGSSKVPKKSLYQDPREAAEISTAPQQDRFDTHSGSYVKARTAPQREQSDTRNVPSRLWASDIKIRTAPQRGRSDRPKVTHNQHRAATRAIRHLQSAEKAAPAHVPFSNNITHQRAHHQKMSPQNPKCCACHAESSSCPKSKVMAASQNAIRDPLKTSSKFTVLLRLPRKTTSKGASHLSFSLMHHWCWCFSKVQKASCLPFHGWGRRIAVVHFVVNPHFVKP